MDRPATLKQQTWTKQGKYVDEMTPSEILDALVAATGTERVLYAVAVETVAADLVADEVAKARADGASWDEIAYCAGLNSRQAAFNRWGAAVRHRNAGKD